MLRYHLINTNLVILLSLVLMNFKAQAQIQRDNENSRKDNIATDNDIELLYDLNAKQRSTNSDHHHQSHQNHDENKNQRQRQDDNEDEQQNENQNLNENENRNQSQQNSHQQYHHHHHRQSTDNCTSGVQFNQSHHETSGEGFVQICQHQVNDTSNNEFDEVPILSSSASPASSSSPSSTSNQNQKSNVNDTFSCFDDSQSSCNVTKEENMQRLYDYLRPGVIKWILILLHTLVFIIGLMGNALVCLAVYVNYSMRTVTNIFIVNLAIADFLVILVCLPPSVVWDLTLTWFLGETMCKFVIYFQTVSITISVLTLTLISIDRWYAICFPLRYRTKISRAITSVSIIWIIALLLDIPEFLTLTVKSGPYDSILLSQCVPTWSESTERKFDMTKLILLFVFPLLLMIAAYFKIATVLWKSDVLLVGLHTSTQRGKTANSRFFTGTSNRGTISQLQARRKAAKMMVVVVIMFAFCYLPVHIFNILRHSGKLEPGQVTDTFALFSHWLCYANSAINPVIYNFMSGKFRREFRNAFVKCRCSNMRVEDNFLYKNGPSSRQQNNTVSMRSYNNLSVRDITRVPYSNSITQKNDDSHL